MRKSSSSKKKGTSGNPAIKASDSPRELSRLRDKFDLFPEEMDDDLPEECDVMQLAAMGMKTSRRNPAGATIILLALAFRAGYDHFPDAEDESLLNRIFAVGGPRARWCLEVAAEWPGMGTIGLQARALAERLAADGVAIEGPQADGKLLYAITTPGDRNGTRVLAVRHDNGDAAEFYLNDATGVKGSIPFQSNNEGDASLESLGGAEIDLLTARSLLDDALAVHCERNTAPPGFLAALLPMLGDYLPRPARRTPNLDAFAADNRPMTAKMWDASRTLADAPIFRNIFITSDWAYDFWQDHKPKRRKGKPGKKAFAEFCRRVATQGLEQILRRMAVNLEIAVLADIAGLKQHRDAARLWFALHGDAMSFSEAPFIQALAERSAASILHDIERGFTNRAEAVADWELNEVLYRMHGIRFDEDDDDDDDDE